MAATYFIRRDAPRRDDAISAHLLRQTQLAEFLNEAQLKEVERIGRPSFREAGATLFHQDEPADMLFVVAEGMVELRARPPGRRAYRTVELIGAKCTVGDEAVAGSGAYLGSGRMLEEGKVIAISRSAFDQLSVTRPDVAVGVLRCCSSCLLETIRRSAILTQAPAEVALRMLLEELSGGNGPRVPRDHRDGRTLRITHAQLAGVLHLSRETVSRILAQMAAEGSIELGRGVIRHRSAGPRRGS